jgi:hypothetical protein
MNISLRLNPSFLFNLMEGKGWEVEEEEEVVGNSSNNNSSNVCSVMHSLQSTAFQPFLPETQKDRKKCETKLRFKSK